MNQIGLTIRNVHVQKKRISRLEAQVLRLTDRVRILIEGNSVHVVRK